MLSPLESPIGLSFHERLDWFYHIEYMQPRLAYAYNERCAAQSLGKLIQENSNFP